MREVKVGSHLIIDYYFCDKAAVNDINIIKSIIRGIAAGIEVVILKESYQEFAPVGITGIAIVSESHISVHTWPEYDYMGIDIFSCREINQDVVLGILKSYLRSDSYNCRYIDRYSVV